MAKIRKVFIEALQVELDNLIKSNRKISDQSRKGFTFVDLAIDRRHENLSKLQKMLSLLSDAEVNKLYERVERDDAQVPPQSLFT